MNISIDLIKKLRDKTLASVSDVRWALEQAQGDLKKAEELLRKKGIEKAGKKGDRDTSEGLIDSYVHQNGKVGVLIELTCETDFVAKTAEFKSLAHEISMQVAAMNPKDVDSLLKQDYIRDGSKTIETLIKETISKLGENITIDRFSRIEIGKK